MLRREGVLPLGSMAPDLLIYLAQRPGEVIAKAEADRSHLAGCNRRGGEHPGPNGRDPQGSKLPSFHIFQFFATSGAESRRCCQPTPSSSATAAPALIGTRATIGSNRDNRHRCRAGWRRWARRCLRDRRQIRPTVPSGRCAGRRRRHADERHGRAHHHTKIFERLGRPAANRLRVQRRGSQRGHRELRDGGQSPI